MTSDANKTREQLTDELATLRQRLEHLEGTVAAQTTRVAGLQNRLEFEELITAVSINFINGPLGEVEQSIDQALQLVGAFLEVDCGYVLLLSDDGKRIDQVYGWGAASIRPRVDDWQNLSVEPFGWMLQKHCRFEAVCVPKVAELPAVAAAEKLYLEMQGVRSLIQVPLVYGEFIFGVLGFAAMRTEMDWSEDTIALLEILSGIMVSALQHKYTEEMLRESEMRYRLLAENTLDLVCLHEPDGRLVYVSPSCRQVLGYPPELLLGQTPQLYVHPEDKIRVFQKLAMVESAGNPITYRARRQDGTYIWLETYVQPISDDQLVPVRLVASSRDVTARKEAEDILARRAVEMGALYETSLEINAQPNLTTLFSAIVQRASCLLGTSMGALHLLGPDGDTLEMVAGYNQPDDWQLNRLQLGEGVAGRVAEVGQPIMITDYSRWQEVCPTCNGDHSIGRALSVPLKQKRRVVGVLEVFDERVGDFTEDEVRLLSLFAAQAAIALHNARLLTEVGQRAIELSTILEAAKVVSSRSDLEEALALIAGQMVKASDAVGCGFYRWEPETNTLSTWIEWGQAGYGPADETAKIRSLSPASPTLAVLRSGRYRIILRNEPGIGPLETDFLDRYRAASLLTLSLAVGEAVIGLVYLARTELQPPQTDQIRLCRALANQAAVAIENAFLHRETRKQARQVRQILDTVPEGILLLGSDYQVQLANPAAQTYLRQLAGLAVGETLSFLGNQPLPDLLAPSGNNTWHEVVLTGPTTRIFAVTAQPVAADQAIEGWVMVIRDITSEHENQQRVEQQKRLAAVGQLAAGIAHDFNNILTSMIGFADLLQRQSDLPGPARKKADYVVRQGLQAAKLIRQILDFSRKSISEMRALNLVPFLKETIKLLERTIPEDIHLSLEIQPGDYVINADAVQIQQALTNLAVNARDAMPFGGTLHFELRHTERATDDPVSSANRTWLVLAVTDSGSGISPDLLPYIFEPFFTTKEVGQGTGLGLAQVYGIIRQHDGEIEVDSQVGSGTTFNLFFPQLAGSEPDPLETIEEALPLGNGELILLVEDDPMVLEVTRSMLADLNYQTVTATNGREALAIYQQQHNEIALVLSDLTMPEMGGLALVDALRWEAPAARIIVMTGYPLAGETLDRLQARGIGWLQKPLGFEQLAQAINHSLRS